MAQTGQQTRPVPLDEQLALIRRGSVAIVREEELAGKLRRALGQGRPLRVKLGVDPSSADLHLGHTVVLRKLRQFQDLGHQAVLIIGDYTGQIGDPSGRDKTRPQRTHAEVLANAETYLAQVGKVLDRNSLEVRYNGEWFQRMTFLDVIALMSRMTVARLLERDAFGTRFEQGLPLSFHELIYPLMQGYDSVMVQADVELGGTDQTFNLLVGRDLQRQAGQEEQACITLPLLVGTDGVQKMGKSLDNYIGINEAPAEMYGKVMSIPDGLLIPYFELVTAVPNEELVEIKAALDEGATNPMALKQRLAREIVALFHSPAAAGEAAAHFARVVQRREAPEAVPEFRFPLAALLPAQLPGNAGGVQRMECLVSNDFISARVGGEEQALPLTFSRLLVEARMAPSRAQAVRLINQGAVEIDETRVAPIAPFQGGGQTAAPVPLRHGSIIRVGKRRFVKILFE
ncbi:MAG: tyrosine--tRNA ligase [Chloroflexi bacterium]|nr:tyrosine--tRNA ligase [Chloroflexota bacterium]